MWISWKDKDTDLARPITVEKKIDIFYQQTLGWQLHVADLIANGGNSLGDGVKVEPIPHSGFAVLQICLSYFETIGKYRALASGDKENFKAGAQDVLPELRSVPDEVRKELLDVLYVDARCGLYHNSRTCRGVGLGQPPNGEAMAYDPNAQRLAISPKRLPKFSSATLNTIGRSCWIRPILMHANASSVALIRISDLNSHRPSNTVL